MFSMAFAFQSVVTQLSDLGFSGSIVSLAGERVHDRYVLGGYLRSARYWRSKIQIVVLLLAAVAYPAVTWGQAWGVLNKTLLFFTIILGVMFQGWNMYGAPLLACRDLLAYYKPQVAAALFRIIACTCFWSVGWLNAWVASLIAALTLGVIGLAYKVSSVNYAEVLKKSEPEKNAHMLHYLAPLMPGVVFTALQAQIQMGVVSIFGSTQNIAEVSALGRLGQLFVLAGAFSNVFVQPYVARLPRFLLLRRYLQIAAIACIFSIAIISCGIFFPGLFLWFLGPNYSGLQNEAFLTLIIGCINMLGGVLFVMHAARAWLFWWSPFVYIPTMLLTQVVCISLMDLSLTSSIVWLGLIISVVSLAIQAIAGVYGFNLKTKSR